MSAYYPIYLRLENKRCLVVGGGEVAQRKVLTLLEYGAQVSVLSPCLSPKLRELAARGTIEWLERSYRAGDAEGFFLLIGATDDRRLHERLAAEAQKYGLLVNIVDVPELCNFIVPAVVRRGDLSIAVSTGGKSPALAKKIRRRLEGEFGPEYGRFLELMGEWRREVIRKVPDIRQRKAIFERMVDSDLLQLLKNGDQEGFRRRVRELTG